MKPELKLKCKRREVEPLDKNKTILTHKLTALAIGHLTVIGCKPIETEVPVGLGMIVDVAGFTYPTMSEMKRGKLLKRAMIENPLLQQVHGSNRDYYANEFITKRHLFPLTAIAEVKVTIADFKKDLDRKFSSNIANINYLVIPKSIAGKVKEILDSKIIDYYRRIGYGKIWSLVICSDSGERVLKSEIPHITSTGVKEILFIISQIAIKRCHRTRYSFMRMALKSYRARRPNHDQS